MSGAFAVRARGWAECESPDELARELLGPGARQSPLAPAPGRWRVEDPAPPDEPIGPTRSVVTFEAAEPLEVRIVPGSQGQGPPPEDAGHAVVEYVVRGGRSLALDARCWYCVPRAVGLRARLWVYHPPPSRL